MQLAAVPSPTTVVGFDASANWPSAGIGCVQAEAGAEVEGTGWVVVGFVETDVIGFDVEVVGFNEDVGFVVVGWLVGVVWGLLRLRFVMSPPLINWIKSCIICSNSSNKIFNSPLASLLSPRLHLFFFLFCFSLLVSIEIVEEVVVGTVVDDTDVVGFGVVVVVVIG